MRRLIVIVIELLILLGMLYVNHYKPDVTVFLQKNTGLFALTNYLIFLVTLDASARIIKYFYSRKHGHPRGKKDNFHFGINNIAKLLIGIGLIVTLFGIFGIDFKSLITSLSIVAAAIAIISKEYVNDFLVGIYFSFSKNFEINDYVKLGDHKGKIQEIAMLKIKLLNEDDDLVIIPNGKVFVNEIINYTKRDIRLMSIDFQLDIKLIENIEVLEKELISALEAYAEFIEPNSYNLKIVEMRKDYIDLKFQYTLEILDRVLQRNIRKNTVRKVFNYISSKNAGKKDVPEMD